MGRLTALVILLALAMAWPLATAEARYAAIVMDAESGQVLYARHADKKRYPASLTKMMTLYLTFEALRDGKLKPGQALKVSKRAQGMPPSRLGLKKGQTISVDDVIMSLVTKSANDAAVVIAEALAGTEVEFGKVMTAMAKELGMKSTSFRNASGLHNRHQKSTARDMARLAIALIRDFPKEYAYFSTGSFKYGGRTYRNHNNLLRYYEGADGIKTGYISASGFNLVASAARDGRRVIGVVFGGKSAKSRNSHMRSLLDRGFKSMRRAVWTPPAPPRRNPLRYAANSQTRVATTTAAAAVPSEIADLLASDLALAAPGRSTAKPGKTKTQSIAAVISSPSTAASTNQAPLAITAASDWGVQVGAFRRFVPAQLAATQAARRLPKILMQTRPVIEQVGDDQGKLYRARLVGLSEPGAREACRRLQAMKHTCVVVVPQSAAADLVLLQ